MMRAAKTSFHQKPAALIDQARPVASQAHPRAEQRMKVKLLFGFDCHEKHGWAGRSVRNRLCVPVAILVNLHVGLSSLGSRPMPAWVNADISSCVLSLGPADSRVCRPLKA